MVYDVMGNTVNVGDAQKGFLVVRIGSDTRPATSQDIKDVENDFKENKFKSLEGVDILVTHHNFECEWISTLTSEEQHQIQASCLKTLRSLLTSIEMLPHRWEQINKTVCDLEASVHGGVPGTTL